MRLIYKKAAVAFFVLLFSTDLSAQETVSFEEINTLIKNYYFASSDIADFDNDGDIDIILCGGTDSFNAGGPTETSCQLYRNDNGVYTPISNFDINSLHLGDVKFIDIDNDSDLDLIITGQNYDDITQHFLYVYENTPTGFELLNESEGLIYSAMDVMDFNNDGKQDFLLTGGGSLSGEQVHLFTNNGTFSISNLNVPKIQNGNIKAFDFNNDNQLDIAIIGLDSAGNSVLRIYKNTNGTMSLHQELANLSFGTLNVADFNADGFLDIVASGYDDNLGNLIKVYFNNPQGIFSEVLSQEGLDLASGAKNIAVGDLNNDGFYDFIVSGDNADYEVVAYSYTYNSSTQNFTKITYNTGIFGLGGNSNIQLFDYDGDNHPDVLLSGFAENESGEYISMTKLFKNGNATVNASPNPPTTLNAQVANGSITFDWSGASDDKTPENALTYYIKVGTTSGSKNLAYYPVTTKSWKINFGTIPQNIYWSIESCDASIIKSISSEEKIVGTLSVSENSISNLKLYPNPTSGIVNIQSESDVESIEIYNHLGQSILSKNNPQLDLSNFSSGIYTIKLTFEDGKSTTQKVIKK